MPVTINPSNDTTGATDTTAFNAAITTLANGGEIILGRGTFYITGWAPARSSITLRGEGRFATTIQGVGSGTHVLKLNGVAWWHVMDLTIDANFVKDTALIIGDAGHSGTHMFECVYFRHANVDTVRMGTGSVNPGYDVADNVFLRCSIDSWSPSNSQLLIEGSNTAQNVFAFCSFGLNGGGNNMTPPAVNVKVKDGGNMFLHGNWAGSTSWDIEAEGGQVIVIGGHTESSGGFFHSTASDANSSSYPPRYSFAPHVIRDFRVVLAGAATSGYGISHEAQRVLQLDNVMTSKSIHVGTNGRLIEKNISWHRGEATTAIGYNFAAAIPQFTDRVYAKVYLSSSVSISPGTWHTLSWSTAVYDHFAVHSGSRLTVPVQQDGWYDVHAQIMFDPNAGGDRAARLKVNGTTYPGGEFYCGANTSGGSTAYLQNSFHDTVFLKAGDYAEVEVMQTSSGWLGVTGGYPSNSWFSLTRRE